jgi:uridine kinase
VSKLREVIFLAGPSCSGKTFLAAQYKQRWGNQAEVICIDDYYRDTGDEELEAELSKYEGRFGSFDMPISYHLAELDAALQQLLGGHDIKVPVYDLPNSRRTIRTRTVQAGKRLYVIEGLYAFYLNQARVDGAVRTFVDAPFAVRLQRRLARDSGRYPGVSDEMIAWVFENKTEVTYREFGYFQRAIAHYQVNTA